MKYYCSTGTFIGRVNGRNHRLIVEYGPQIQCDGFEFMMADTWYDKIDEILRDLDGCGLTFPTFHGDKETGNMISSLPDEEFGKCIDLWKINMEVAAHLGSKKAVCHIWGRPDSDGNLPRIFERVQQLRKISASYGIDMLSENNVVLYGSPMEHMLEFIEKDPTFGVIIDTRAAQFHRELEATCDAVPLWKNVRHIHISDMHGGYKQWDAMYPILAPGEGDVDFPRFFRSLHALGYDNTITLESPAMRPDSVGVDELNRFMQFIRYGVENAKKGL